MSLEPTKEDVEFGTGNSAAMFLMTLNDNKVWQLSNQKQFLDL